MVMGINSADRNVYLYDANGVPITLGQKAQAQSVPVTLSSDGSVPLAIGARTDAKDSHTDATAVSMIALLKQLSALLQGAGSLTSAPLRHDASADGLAGSAVDEVALAAWNGSSLDRIVTAQAADNTTNPKIPGVGLLVTTGGTFRLNVSGASGDALPGNFSQASAPYLRNPSGTDDRARTLAASGFGLGVALKSGAYVAPADVVTSPRSTANVNVLDFTPDNGVRKRALWIYNATDQALHCSAGPLNNNFVAGINCYFNIAAGVAACVTSQGVFNVGSGDLTGITGVSPNFVQLDVPGDRFRVYVQPLIAPTTGTVTTTYRGLT